MRGKAEKKRQRELEIKRRIRGEKKLHIKEVEKEIKKRRGLMNGEGHEEKYDAFGNAKHWP